MKSLLEVKFQDECLLRVCAYGLCVIFTETEGTIILEQQNNKFSHNFQILFRTSRWKTQNSILFFLDSLPAHASFNNMYVLPTLDPQKTIEHERIIPLLPELGGDSSDRKYNR